LLAYNAADTESLAPLASLLYKEMMRQFGPGSSPSAFTTPTFHRVSSR
jgi:hypothetical protein